MLAQNAVTAEDCNGRLLFVRLDTPGCHLCPRIVLRDVDGRERDLVRFTAKNVVWNPGPHCDRAILEHLGLPKKAPVPRAMVRVVSPLGD